MLIRSDRTYAFDGDVDAVWRALGDTASYQRWWPWLRHFDGRELRAGTVWRCVVRPPQPYPGAVALDVHLDTVEPHRRVVAHIDGDIAGQAALELLAGPCGCRVRMVSQLAPASRWLRIAAFVFAPVLRLGHDRVMAAAARQFAAGATAQPG